MKKIGRVGALVFVCLCSSGVALAELVPCQGVVLENVAVQGPRDDNHFFQNRLTIKLEEECAGKRYIHANLEHPAFNSFLSIALTAKSSAKPVNIAVNTSQTTPVSNQISYISLATQ